MNIKQYLMLSDQKLQDLENKYNYLPAEADIESLKLSADKSCLKETARIARLHSLQKKTLNAEKKLQEKRKEALKSLFIRPE